MAGNGRTAERENAPKVPHALKPPAMPLSDTSIRNAKPEAKPRKLSDSWGMYLLVTHEGGKLWRLKYRFGVRKSCSPLARTLTLA
ncbi:Arm DNA-binding domain-containing protein [Desulfocurvibacter africanus]|uniref:Arm DNA-binding domain-containing protein n=1 Tax=Desulfocurvibacter africanus TaxID=873 RepID=UPI0030840746